MATPYHKSKREGHTDYLDWFDNSRYQYIELLEPWQILALLEERVTTYPAFMLRFSVDKDYTKKIKNRVKRIQVDPLYYKNTNYSDLPSFAKKYFNNRKKSVSPIIKPLSQDVYSAEHWDNKEISEQLQSLELYTDFECKEHPGNTSTNTLNIEVDLTAPESKIKADFSELLKVALNARNKHLKQQLKVRSIPKFSTSNKVFEGLINHRVLQYLDVLITLDHLQDEYRFSTEKQAKITMPSDRYIARIIFSEMDEDDAWDKFREFTKPKAMQILDRNSGYLERLASAVNN